MNDFQFHRPSSLAEVFDLLSTHGDDARLMAGGTALVMQMKQRLAQPGHVIGLGGLRGAPGLDSIEAAADYHGAMRIGALCTHRQVETSPLVHRQVPLLAEAYRQVATPRIRHMATVGGGLAHGDPNQDPPPVLIALGASVILTSAHGQRTLPVDQMFVDYFETAIQPGEVITSILVPPPPPNAGTAYLKFLPRTADDYATVSVAVVLTPGRSNICQDVRIALGSVGMTPVHATQAEARLRGRPLTEENIRACAAAVVDEVDPLDDYRGPASYKREMAQVFTRRAIHQALAAAGRTPKQ
ncbi:MAG TPA: xanthine dehydrogenase family protein subunit M [Dehalococcoidia bacterium]|nr:xanthine dehydrogenase family protein subunit M [Dehalococcoidia bacterium]